MQDLLPSTPGGSARPAKVTRWFACFFLPLITTRTSYELFLPFRATNTPLASPCHDSPAATGLCSCSVSAHHTQGRKSSLLAKAKTKPTRQELQNLVRASSSPFKQEAQEQHAASISFQHETAISVASCDSLLYPKNEFYQPKKRPSCRIYFHDLVAIRSSSPFRNGSRRESEAGFRASRKKPETEPWLC